MAFTFTTLKTTIADFLNRSDLTSVIPTFIELAEAEFNRSIRHYEMEARANATLNAQYFVTPAGWIENIRFRTTGANSNPIEMTSNAAISDMRRDSNDAAGKPKFFSFVDGTFDLYPTPDTDYASELIYYKSIPALADSAPTNWILSSHPDAYLYTALVHSAPYLAEDQRMQTWAALSQRAINDINNDNDRAKYSTSGLTMRRRGLASVRRNGY
jgi:hypothetical protein